MKAGFSLFRVLKIPNTSVLIPSASTVHLPGLWRRVYKILNALVLTLFSLMNFTRVLSEPVALSELNELIILYMSRVIACGKLNLLYFVTDDLLATTLRWFLYASMTLP